MWRSFNRVFQWLPHAAVIEDSVLCCHSPDMRVPLPLMARIARGRPLVSKTVAGIQYGCELLLRGAKCAQP